MERTTKTERLRSEATSLPTEPPAQPVPVFSENALRVLRRRYLRRDASGQVIETPREMLWRVARNVAAAELAFNQDADLRRTAEDFYRLMAALEFLPNSPTLMNAGNVLQQLAACFVLPVEDSIEGIGTAVTQAMLIHKSGGGTGFAFSRLRPRGDIVASTGGVASGPVSFMRIFDTATEQVKQGGTRRGANMGILRVDHPDILEFIAAKRNGGLNNFNISVAVTEEFMKLVEADGQYPLINPRSRQVWTDAQTGKEVWLSAREVFDQLVEGAWATGDPGIVLLDRVNAENPTPGEGEIESTNPCGEQPLLAFEACNLGSVNLARMVKDGSVDWERLREVVTLSVRFLDNVVEASRYPLPEIEQMAKRGNRKVGLGVMGWADMLIRLGIPYDSEEAVALAEEMMLFIWETAWEASVALAEARGAFPNFERSVFALPAEEAPSWVYRPGVARRNATVTTVAPTGTISLIAGCSSGIEPLFAVVYERHVLDGEVLLEVNPELERIARERGFYSQGLMERIARDGNAAHVEEVPRDVRPLFVTAHDVAPVWHVRMQAAFQKTCDNAVSKTVNFPQEATKEDVAEVYRLAYQLGCKGITVYRDRSKEAQVLTVGTEQAKGTVWRRPEILFGATYRIATGYGEDLYLTVNEDDRGDVRELFANISRVGSDLAADAQGHGILASTALQSTPRPDPEVLIRRLSGIGGSSLPGPRKDLSAKSIPDGIAVGLRSHMEMKRRGSLNHLTRRRDLALAGLCPICRSPNYRHEEGCRTCGDCGYSECG